MDMPQLHKWYTELFEAVCMAVDDLEYAQIHVSSYAAKQHLKWRADQLRLAIGKYNPKNFKPS